MGTRDAFLVAAGSAADLLDHPAVAGAWTKPSALTGFTVGGLAEHLGSQVLFVSQALQQPAPAGEPVSLLGHYSRVTWIGADLDAEVNVAIRKGGEDAAGEGPGPLVARTRAAVRELCDRLPKEPADRTVAPPSGPWGLRLDDFLVTRMMEIAVHADGTGGVQHRAVEDADVSGDRARRRDRTGGTRVRRDVAEPVPALLRRPRPGERARDTERLVVPVGAARRRLVQVAHHEVAYRGGRRVEQVPVHPYHVGGAQAGGAP